MNLELEWYECVRAGLEALCDRCNENISKDNFDSNRNQRGVYCYSCWNFIHLRKWKCNTCKSTGTMRNERLLPKICCEENVIWLK